jgi:hypothetical protein
MFHLFNLHIWMKTKKINKKKKKKQQRKVIILFCKLNHQTVTSLLKFKLYRFYDQES